MIRHFQPEIFYKIRYHSSRQIIDEVEIVIFQASKDSRLKTSTRFYEKCVITHHTIVNKKIANQYYDFDVLRLCLNKQLNLELIAKNVFII
jgi:hypothetical protein